MLSVWYCLGRCQFVITSPGGYQSVFTYERVSDKLVDFNELVLFDELSVGSDELVFFFLMNFVLSLVNLLLLMPFVPDEHVVFDTDNSATRDMLVSPKYNTGYYPESKLAVPCCPNLFLRFNRGPRFRITSRTQLTSLECSEGEGVRGWGRVG